jgi:hypothetical protein
MSEDSTVAADPVTYERCEHLGGPSSTGEPR